jgi:hypothetical protein
MIVGYQPGGTIKDSRVVLRPEELLPNEYNIPQSAVYRENPDDPREWVLVKPRGEVLPADSPLLSKPEAVEVDIKDTTEAIPATFEHRDIIQLED